LKGVFHGPERDPVRRLLATVVMAVAVSARRMDWWLFRSDRAVGPGRQPPVWRSGSLRRVRDGEIGRPSRDGTELRRSRSDGNRSVRVEGLRRGGG